MDHVAASPVHEDHVLLKRAFPSNTDPVHYSHPSRHLHHQHAHRNPHAFHNSTPHGSPDQQQRQLDQDLQPSNCPWTGAMRPANDVPFARPEKRAKLFPTSAVIESSHGEGGGTVNPKSPQLSSSVDRGMSAYCQECSNTGHLLEIVGTVIVDLQIQISRTYKSFDPNLSTKTAFDSEITRYGLRAFLTWAIEQIQITSQALQEFSHAPSSLPSLAEAIARSRPAQSHQSPPPPVRSPQILPNLREPHRTALPSNIDRAEEYAVRSAESGIEARFGQIDHGVPQTTTLSEPQRHHSQERFAGLAAAPPPPPPFVPQSSTSSQANTGHSPAQSHVSSYALPSPPISHHTGIVPATSGLYGSGIQMAQNAHFQDLQHQISTKTLALQTLQREHDQLLAAFSRSQMRCSTLDKKSQVADHEINTLIEERSQLQKQLEMVEEQVTELSRSREELHKQLTNDGAQWRRIMAMSSQLEIKGAEEARKYKADREEWEKERTELHNRIRDLQAVVSRSNEPPSWSGPGLTREELANVPTEQLVAEVERLRAQCTEMYNLLSTTMNEVANIDQAVAGMAKVRQRFKEAPVWARDASREQS